MGFSRQEYWSGVPLMVIIAVIPEGYGNMKYLKLCIKLLANGLAAVKSDAG